MKLVLLLSFLELGLAYNITAENRSFTVRERIETQLPNNRINVIYENLRRKSIASSAPLRLPGATIDGAPGDRHVNSSTPRPSKKRPFRKLPIPCISLKCLTENIKISRSKVQGELKPTKHIGLADSNKLAGPEGKIAEALVRSINTTREPLELILNFMPIYDRGPWSLVYHPYRKVPLVPVIQRGIGNAETQVTFCLLTMLTIMIVMLLHVMRNLIQINDLKTSDAFEFLKCVALPKGFMSGVEKFFYLCLVFTFFVNLGIILEIIFREKYGKNKFEKIRGIDDLDQLDLTPVFSTEECLRQLVIKKSKRVYCIVDEDFGREVVRRYGKDGRDRLIQLVDAFHFEFEWRGMYFDDGNNNYRHLDRFNDVQLKLLQSGLLDKWYRDEMIVNLGKDEREMKRVRDTWSGRLRDEGERLRKFVYFLMLTLVNGALMTFLMFVAECVMQCSGVGATEEREIQYQWK